VLAHGLIFGQVFFNAAKGSIPTAQPIKNANECIQAFRGLHGIHLTNIVRQSSINPTAIRVVVKYL
jgi:hypothetical protein